MMKRIVFSGLVAGILAFLAAPVLGDDAAKVDVPIQMVLPEGHEAPEWGDAKIIANYSGRDKNGRFRHRRSGRAETQLKEDGRFVVRIPAAVFVEGMGAVLDLRVTDGDGFPYTVRTKVKIAAWESPEHVVRSIELMPYVDRSATVRIIDGDTGEPLVGYRIAIGRRSRGGVWHVGSTAIVTDDKGEIEFDYNTSDWVNIFHSSGQPSPFDIPRTTFKGTELAEKEDVVLIKTKNATLKGSIVRKVDGELVPFTGSGRVLMWKDDDEKRPVWALVDQGRWRYYPPLRRRPVLLGLDDKGELKDFHVESMRWLAPEKAEDEKPREVALVVERRKEIAVSFRAKSDDGTAMSSGTIELRHRGKVSRHRLNGEEVLELKLRSGLYHARFVKKGYRGSAKWELLKTDRVVTLSAKHLGSLRVQLPDVDCDGDFLLASVVSGGKVVSHRARMGEPGAAVVFNNLEPGQYSLVLRSLVFRGEAEMFARQAFDVKAGFNQWSPKPARRVRLSLSGGDEKRMPLDGSGFIWGEQWHHMLVFDASTKCVVYDFGTRELKAGTTVGLLPGEYLLCATTPNELYEIRRVTLSHADGDVDVKVELPDRKSVPADKLMSRDKFAD